MTSEAAPTPFARLLSDAIDQSGLSLSAIHHHLAARGVRVSLPALSYWRSGQRRPEGDASLDAVAALEDLLHLTSGSLAAALGPSRRLGAVAERAPYADLMDGVPSVEETLRELGLHGSHDSLMELSIQITIDVDELGVMHSQRVRTLYRAVRDQVDRLPLLLTSGGEPWQSAPRLLELHGAAQGRSVVDLQHGLCVYELCLERGLAAGETTIVEHSITFPPLADGLDTCYEHYLVRRVAELQLWVRFDGRRLPRSAQTYVRDLDDLESVTFLQVHGATSAHHNARGVGPGTVGLRWAWW